MTEVEILQEPRQRKAETDNNEANTLNTKAEFGLVVKKMIIRA